MKRHFAKASMLAALLLSGGCLNSPTSTHTGSAGPDPSPDSPWPSRTTLTAPSLQPPPQTQLPPGVKPIRFDPCTFISDDLIRKVGGRPETRVRNDFTGENPFFFCTVKGQHPSLESLAMESTNFTLAAHRARKDAVKTDIRVNGRDAVRYFFPTPNGKPRGSCSVYMEAPDGTFGVTVTSVGHNAAPLDTCAAATDAATILETALEGK